MILASPTPKAAAPSKSRGNAKKAPAATEAATSPGKVVSAIYRGILAGRIVPGQKLIEADLASSLNVSRGPIREAFNRLQAEGVIENTRHRGAYVRILRRQEAFDFLEILSMLTGFIARKAAEAISGADEDFRKRYEQALDSLRHFLDPDVGENFYHESSRRFYSALIEMGGNSQIASIMPVMRIQLFRMQGHSAMTPHAQEQRTSEYADIARHVLAGDPAGAQKAMARHMRLTLKRLHAMPDDAFAPD